MTRVVSFHDHALLPDFGLSLSRSVYAGIPEEPEHSDGDVVLMGFQKSTVDKHRDDRLLPGRMLLK